MDTKDIQTSTWLLAIGAQRPPTPGAVAHMSLHLKQQCQRATPTRPQETKSGGQPSFPDLTRGDECPSNDWATNPAAHLSSTASVNSPLRSLPTTVNPTLQFHDNPSQKSRFSASPTANPIRSNPQIHSESSNESGFSTDSTVPFPDNRQIRRPDSIGDSLES